MKRIFLLLFLSVSLMAFGQKTKYSEVTFFGTDFSQVKVYGADNSAYQFQEAFNAINKLYLYEPKKYDVGKILGVDIKAIDLKAVEKQNDGIELSQLMIDGYGGYQITDQQLEQAIKSLPIDAREGTGLVLVAEILNKSSRRGAFKIVFFDITSKEILEVRNGKGKAGGYGLRNYWAHAMLEAIKKAK